MATFTSILERDIKKELSTQLSLLLEVRKLLKLLGVAYLEGRLKSRYCSLNSMNNVIVNLYTYF